MDLEILEKAYLEIIEKAEKNYITSFVSSKEQQEASLRGENKVFKILKMNCNQIFQSVVVWNKKSTFTTEMDFVCFISGHLLIVEVKDWYGNMSINKNQLTVTREYIDFKGYKVIQDRTNPFFATKSFSVDFERYMKIKHEINVSSHLKKFVIFTRDDFKITNLHENKISVTSLFNHELQSALDHLNENPIEPITSFPINLPSWDYTVSNKGVFHNVVLNKEIQIEDFSIPTNQISHIVFDKDFNNPANILLKSGKYFKGKINRDLIELSGHNKLSRTSISFIKFNEFIHY
jgi:hypothetical protein